MVYTYCECITKKTKYAAFLQYIKKSQVYTELAYPRISSKAAAWTLILTSTALLSGFWLFLLMINEGQQEQTFKQSCYNLWKFHKQLNVKLTNYCEVWWLISAKQQMANKECSCLLICKWKDTWVSTSSSPPILKYRPAMIYKRVQRGTRALTECSSKWSVCIKHVLTSKHDAGLSLFFLPSG